MKLKLTSSSLSFPFFNIKTAKAMIAAKYTIILIHVISPAKYRTKNIYAIAITNAIPTLPRMVPHAVFKSVTYFSIY